MLKFFADECVNQDIILSLRKVSYYWQNKNQNIRKITRNRSIKLKERKREKKNGNTNIDKSMHLLEV